MRLIAKAALGALAVASLGVGIDAGTPAHARVWVGGRGVAVTRNYGFNRGVGLARPYGGYYGGYRPYAYGYGGSYSPYAYGYGYHRPYGYYGRGFYRGGIYRRW
jgi:hypothetical protein